MKKILPLILCILLFNSCNIENKKITLNNSFSGIISFKYNETEYSGEIEITDYNNMSVKFLSPDGVKNTVLTYTDGNITTSVEGQSFDGNWENSVIPLFFGSMKKILSMNNECNYLNGMYVFSNSESTLYVNENGEFDRLVCYNRTFYFTKK